MSEARKASRKPARKASPKGKQLKGSQVMSMLQERQRMVAEAAYYRAQQRGFAAGDELSDWLEAEKEVDRRLGGSR